MKVGYARVSTDEQNLSLQLDALKRAGCVLVFEDAGISGLVMRRPALERALRALRPGDTLVTWKLDRLGRSLAHLLSLIAELEQRHVDLHSLSEAFDTSTAGGRLIFHVMGALAEFERALISERTRAGIAAAKSRGKLIGRPPKLSADDVEAAHALFAGGLHGLDELAEGLSVSPLTLSRAFNRLLLERPNFSR